MQDLQKIINSRGGSSSNSLLENFQKSAKEAAKIPAEILKSPAQPEAPAPVIPLPITKALPQPTSKAAATSKFVVCSHLQSIDCVMALHGVQDQGAVAACHGCFTAA